MPRKKPEDEEKPSSSAIPGVPANRVRSNATATSRSAMLVTPSHPALQHGPPSFTTPRPTLPPLSHLQTLSASHISPAPYSAPLASHGQTTHHRSHGTYGSPGSQQTLPRLSTDPRSYGVIPLRPGAGDQNSVNVSTEAEYSPTSIGRSYNPLKRGAEYSEYSAERPSHHGVPPYAPQPEPNDPRAFSDSRSVSVTSTPTTASYPTFGQPTFSSRHSATSSNMSSRIFLHIRQQPRAARAGPDGKDRRPIDPPPVLQLLMTDFDPDNQSDIDELQNSYYVVQTRLISATSPPRDVSTLASTTEDGSREIQRLLLGTAVASPHHTKDDPDHETMPQHPTSAESSGPPSPTSRFIPVSTRKGKQRAPSSMPCTFFIFADVSVRKAGEYRLEFSLMKVEAATLLPGSSIPTLHSVASQVFKVVNAKDFDQVQPSTVLIRGLIERGAGFPLKLKKGIREGQKRRPGDRMDTGSQEGDDSDENDDDD